MIRSRKLGVYLLELMLIYVLFYKTWDPSFEIEFVHYRRENFTVFDCFLYNGESQMLYIHLWRLYHYVDHFIITIAKQTHSGKKNKVSFEPFEKEIAQFMDKVKIVRVDFNKAPQEQDTPESWIYEHYQRDQAIVGVKEFNPRFGDLILSTDCDEIPTRSGMQEILLNPPDYFYWLNGVLTPNNYLQSFEEWFFACVIRYSHSMEKLSEYRLFKKIDIFPGDHPILTHCSYCFSSIDMYLRKIKSFAHTEFNKYPYTDPNFIFRVNYCRRHLPFYQTETKPIKWNDSDLIPFGRIDPRLSYLVDPNFMLDITKTNYTMSDLPTLCDGLSDYYP